MTGDLNILMQVRNKKVSKDMNVRVAEEVGEKAELGYFDTEFTMYGCAFLNPQDGKMYYKVSSLAITTFVLSSDLTFDNSAVAWEDFLVN